MNIHNIANHFSFTGNFVNGFRYGSGHINETYVVVYEQQHCFTRYLLQKINTKIFTNPIGLMSNIRKVLDFAHEVIFENGGNPSIEALTIIQTKDNKDFYIDDSGEFWRAYLFIEYGTGFEIIETSDHFYESGVAFGRFTNLLQKFPATELVDTIPNFHNTKIRFENLLKALDENKANRRQSVVNEINFFLERKAYSTRIVDMLESGKMPYRVTHNDTKLNNVLINPLTGKALCVIDLDTIMKGSVLYDFGDSIRFGANHSAEDEKDLSKVNFDLELFESFTKGFVGELKESLTRIEIEEMAFGAILMTYECGMRFLTDYLNGDTYFRTHYTDQNLNRTRTQIKLVQDMEKVINQMNMIVKKYAK